jgi:hypothetical protein
VKELKEEVQDQNLGGSPSPLAKIRIEVSDDISSYYTTKKKFHNSIFRAQNKSYSNHVGRKSIARK